MKNLKLYEKSLEVRLRNINGRTVLINSESGRCFEINNIGKVLWKGIGKATNVIEHLEKQGIKLPDDKSVVEKDAKNFVDFLVEEKLVNES